MSRRQATSSTRAKQRQELLREMVRIRRFEERCVELYSAAEIRGFMHLYIGEEAVAVGLLKALSADDAVVSTYREHGHALARGVPMESVLAKMFGRSTGCSRGRGGSMHLFDISRRFYGGNAIVGDGLPIAVGLALADAMRARPQVTACLFGDGAVTEGEFHECLNLAALWRLPVPFCCENNLYAMGTALSRTQAETDLALRASVYGLRSWPVDDMDVEAVQDAANRAVESIRAGSGPCFLDLRTYRFRAHSMYDPERYREKSEVDHWNQFDPIDQLINRMRADDGITDEILADLQSEVDTELEHAVDAAKSGGDAGSATPRRPRFPHGRGHRLLRRMLRHQPRPARRIRPVHWSRWTSSPGSCTRSNREHRAHDLSPERIRDTPLSKAAFVGASIGAAIGGIRPIVEIMTVFSLPALDQILNNAATLLHMSGGQLNVSLVIRMTTGAGRQLAAQHSHSLEGWYAHIPRLLIITPATLEDARGMLWTALEDPDPVLLFEHGSLYNAAGELDEHAGPVDIDTAAIRRDGTDVTLITYGGTLPITLTAAEQLATDNIDAQVIDQHLEQAALPQPDDVVAAAKRAMTDMAEFRMPSLGADMDQGTVLEWHVAVGDTVRKGDIIAVIDTSKAAVEVECFDTGIIDRLLIQPGQTVSVGTPLATITAGAEGAPSGPAPAGTPPVAPLPCRRASTQGRNGPAQGPERSTTGAQVRRRATRH